MPAAAMEFITGISPVLTACATTLRMAVRRVAPSANWASIAARSRFAVWVTVLRTRLTLVSALPSTMPKIGST